MTTDVQTFLVQWTCVPIFYIQFTCHVHLHLHMYVVCVHVHVGISIVDADITTDILEPADFSRFVSALPGVVY